MEAVEVTPNHRVNRTAGKRCLPLRFGLRPSAGRLCGALDLTDDYRCQH